MRLLVDTNVYLDFLFKREKFEDADLFFYKAAAYNHQTYVTSMSLRDIEYAAYRASHSKKIAKSLQFKAYEMTSKVISVTADSAINALYSDIEDFEDALQVLSAEETMLDAIITSDKKLFRESTLPIYTPREICELWEKSNISVSNN